MINGNQNIQISNQSSTLLSSNNIFTFYKINSTNKDMEVKIKGMMNPLVNEVNFHYGINILDSSSNAFYKHSNIQKVQFNVEQLQLNKVEISNLVQN